MLWTFDDCVLDLERRELRRADVPAAVEPQVFDLWLYLLRNRARVVTKDDLVQAVWQRRIVSDSALANRMMWPAIGYSGGQQFVRCQGRGFVSPKALGRRAHSRLQG